MLPTPSRSPSPVMQLNGLNNASGESNTPCREALGKFHTSGDIAEKFSAASSITEHLVSSERSLKEIRDFPRPNNFTPFHFAALAVRVDIQQRVNFIERLSADPDLSKLLLETTEKRGVDDLYFEANGARMPLANGDLPAHIATFTDSLDALQALLSAEEKMKGFVDCPENNSGNNYFNLAANNLKMMDYLCSKFADNVGYQQFITHRTHRFQTPLHQTARNHNIPVFAKLLFEGANNDLSALNSDDQTPLDLLAPDTETYKQLCSAVSDCCQSDDDLNVKVSLLYALNIAYQTYQNNKEEYLNLRP